MPSDSTPPAATAATQVDWHVVSDECEKAFGTKAAAMKAASEWIAEDRELAVGDNEWPSSTGMITVYERRVVATAVDVYADGVTEYVLMSPDELLALTSDPEGASS